MTGRPSQARQDRAERDRLTLGIAALFAPDPEMTEAERMHSYKKEIALTQPRVVIVGGGFGGLYAARALAGAPVGVTLIDKRNQHLFRPLLYQAATGLLSGDEISGSLRSILNRQNNIDVLLGEVAGVDTQKRVVRIQQHDGPYDFLILATGVQHKLLWI